MVGVAFICCTFVAKLNVILKNMSIHLLYGYSIEQ